MDRKFKLKERIEIMEQAEHDYEFQLLLKEKFKRDPIYFFQTMAWTYDPRRKPYYFPFILYPFQEGLIHWIEDRYANQEDGLLDKSRDMGATFIFTTWFYYKWLLFEDFHAHIGSRKEELVDKKGDINSLFGKIIFNIERTPKWLLPHGFNIHKPAYRTHMFLNNPLMGSTILGEATNPSFGRQGRASVVYIDEFAFINDAEQIWQSVGDTAPSRFVVSTPNPDSNAGEFFRKLRHDGKTPAKSLHWSLHPGKDVEWYEKQKKKRTKREIEVELDLVYSATSETKVYPEFELARHEDLKYDPRLPMYVSSDFGVGDETAIIYIQRELDDPKYVRVLKTYSNSNKSIDFYIPLWAMGDKLNNPEIKEIIKKYTRQGEYGEEELNIIKENRGWKTPIYFGDPAMKQRSILTNTSILTELAKVGIHMKSNAKFNSFDARITRTKKLMRRLKVNNSCKYFKESINSYRYQDVERRERTSTATKKPIHNWASHLATALEFYSVCEPRPGGVPEKISYFKKKSDDDDNDDTPRRPKIMRGKVLKMKTSRRPEDDDL